MSGLSDKHCSTSHEAAQPLSHDAVAELLKQLDQWEVVNGHHLHKDYTFADFQGALAFVNRVGALAEREGHHPVITLTWGAASIDLWTHQSDGLTENDFILAAGIDRIPAG